MCSYTLLSTRTMCPQCVYISEHNKDHKKEVQRNLAVFLSWNYFNILKHSWFVSYGENGIENKCTINSTKVKINSNKDKESLQIQNIEQYCYWSSIMYANQVFTMFIQSSHHSLIWMFISMSYSPVTTNTLWL